MAAKLDLRTMIPPFQLMSVDGLAINIWDFKGKKNSALVFLPGEQCPSCRDFLEGMVRMYHQFEEENALVLAIVRGDMESARSLHESLNPPFPVLIDDTGAVTDAYTRALPAVFVADRFGELYAEWIGDFP